MQLLLEPAAALVLLAMVALCFLTLHGYRFSVRPLLQGVAWILQRFAIVLPVIGRIGPGPWLAKQLHALDKLILTSLAYGIDRGEWALLALWNGTAALSEWIAREIASVARDAAGGLEHLATGGFRKLRKTIERLITASIVAAYRRLLKIIGTLTHGLGRRIIALVNRLVGLQRWARHWVGYTWKTLRAALRRLGHLGWLTGVAGIGALGHLIFRKLGLRWLTHHKGLAAFGIAVLAKLGLGWLRCNNVGKAGKAICRADADWLDDLLAAGIVLAGTVSLREFIRDVQTVEDEAYDALRGFIREF